MYDAFSVTYDRFVNWQARLVAEMPFLERQLKSLSSGGVESSHILDAACGTGMHAIALAQRGYRVMGADLSQPMVERARENAAASGVAVRFEAVGFGRLQPEFSPERFDALLCLGNSLPHLLTLLSLYSALDDFAACLRPGGLLFIQNRNFDAVMAQQQRWMEPQAQREEAREWLFLRCYDFDPDGLITFHVLSLYREGDGAWQQQVTSTRLRPLYQAELLKALSDAGFDAITCYGSMAGEEFEPSSSGNLVVSARKCHDRD
jgi:glycine/sarcosine N-methyltransferase